MALTRLTAAECDSLVVRSLTASSSEVMWSRLPVEKSWNTHVRVTRLLPSSPSATVLQS